MSKEQLWKLKGLMGAVQMEDVSNEWRLIVFQLGDNCMHNLNI